MHTNFLESNPASQKLKTNFKPQDDTGLTGLMQKPQTYESRDIQSHPEAKIRLKTRPRIHSNVSNETNLAKIGYSYSCPFVKFVAEALSLCFTPKIQINI